MYTIRVMDLETRALLADEIPNTYYTLEWANDNRTFFYTMLDSAKRPYQVYRHTLGEKENPLIYHEEDQRYTLALEKTSSRAYILINIDSPVTSEVRYVSAEHPYTPFQVVLPRVQEVEYDLTHQPGQDNDSFYIRTNDNAKTFRVVRAPVGDSSRPNWQEFLPQRDRVTVESVHAFRDYLVIEERDRGLN